MNIGRIYLEVMSQITDISEQVAEWQTAIAELSAKADRWLTVSTVCAWIGCVLSIVALALLIDGIRKDG